MYSLFGFDENVKTLFALSNSRGPAVVNSADDLREAFLRFLHHLQPSVPRLPAGQIFSECSRTDAALAQMFVMDPALMDRGQTTMIGKAYQHDEKARRTTMARAALLHVRERQPHLYVLLTLAINAIFFYDSQRAIGGSTSNGIGAIWLTGGRHPTLHDYAELLIHELTHNLLNIDEVRFGHYDYEVAQRPESYATSAIMKVPRPVHKVVHTIVVSTELVLARRAFLDHGARVTVHASTSELERNARDAIASVRTMRNLDSCVTHRVFEILEACTVGLDRARLGNRK